MHHSRTTFPKRITPRNHFTTPKRITFTLHNQNASPDSFPYKIYLKTSCPFAGDIFAEWVKIVPFRNSDKV
jgi:hypothetical protein